MGETYSEPSLARYRDRVTELMRAGEPFGLVEDAIEAVEGLTENAKAALWLLAFSLRDSRDQVRAAHAHVAALC